MKKLLVVLLVAAPLIVLAGEAVSGEPNIETLPNATEIINKVLGEDWKDKEIKYSYFTLNVPKKEAFCAAVQVSLAMGFIPIICDLEAGVLVVTSTPQQALSGSIFQAYLFEEGPEVPGAPKSTMVTMRTKYLYFSRYSGWDTDSAMASPFHKLAAVFMAITAHSKHFSRSVVEGAMTDPRKTMEKLKGLFGE